MLKVTLATLVANKVLSYKEGQFLHETLNLKKVPSTFKETVEQIKLAKKIYRRKYEKKNKKN